MNHPRHPRTGQATSATVADVTTSGAARGDDVPSTDLLRIDPLSGTPTRIVPSRQSRPNLPSDECPFCPGGLEAPEPYEVLAFPNRWPPMPDERAEILLYSPEHDADLGRLEPSQIRRLVDLWAERSAVLGARPDVDYVLIFENRGSEVGATIAHPHGQLYAFDTVPPAAARELTSSDADRALDAAHHVDRLVVASSSWSAWVPAAAGWPYELLLAPGHEVADLPSLSPGDRDGLALMLNEVVRRLDALFDAPMPYMMWIHQRPFDGAAWPGARLHLHIAPLLRAPGIQRFMAAGELGSGVLFNPVDPITAAAALRTLDR